MTSELANTLNSCNHGENTLSKFRVALDMRADNTYSSRATRVSPAGRLLSCIRMPLRNLAIGKTGMMACVDRGRRTEDFGQMRKGGRVEQSRGGVVVAVREKLREPLKSSE